MNFDQAFHILLGHEGGFEDHPDDPGGATNWGVTEKVARSEGYTGHMKDLPVDFAKAVYRRMYWDAVKADRLPEGVRFDVFDGAVNSGPRQSIRWLQEALGVSADGVIGPVTLSAASAANPDRVAKKFNGLRLKFMTTLKHWPSFSRGWAVRIAENLQRG